MAITRELLESAVAGVAYSFCHGSRYKQKAVLSFEKDGLALSIDADSTLRKELRALGWEEKKNGVWCFWVF